MCRFLFVGVLLVVSSISYAQVPETVRVLAVDASDESKFHCCVELILPSSMAPKVRTLAYHDEITETDQLPFETPVEPPISSDGSSYYAVRKSPDGAPEAHFYVYPRKASSNTRLALAIQDRRYVVELPNFVLGALAPLKPGEYGPLKGLRGAADGLWTRETIERTHRATVRILTPTGVGTGTVVRTPKELEQIVGPNRALVATAGHVAGDYLLPDQMAIEFVSDNPSGRPETRKLIPARFLCSQYDSGTVDDSFLMFETKGRAVERIPIAESDRWFVLGTRYLANGCPEGGVLRSEFVYPIQASYQSSKGRFVDVEQASLVGESGGALFDSEGYLMGVRSTVDQKARSVTIGTQLLDAPEEFRQSPPVITTRFFHLSARGSLRQRIRSHAAISFESAIGMLNDADAEQLKRQYASMMERAIPGE